MFHIQYIIIKMNKYILPFSTIIVFIVLFFLHKYGISEYWYIYFPYLDIVNHFLGGVGIAMTILWLSKNTKYIIIFTIIAGIIWEVFEVYFDITGWPVSSIDYKLDTVKDLIMDTYGAIAVWLIAKKYRNKIN